MEYRELVESYVARNAEALRLMREIRHLRDQEGNRFYLAENPAELRPLRNSIRLLRVLGYIYARTCHDVRGDDYECLETIRDLLSIAELLRHMRLGGGGPLASDLVEARAWRLLETLLPEFQGPDSPPEALPTGSHPSGVTPRAPTREQLHAVIGVLLCDRDMQEGYLLNLYYEQAIFLDLAQRLIDHDLGPEATHEIADSIVTSLATSTAIDGIRAGDYLIAKSKRTCIPEALRQSVTEETERALEQTARCWPENVLGGYYGHLAMRHMAATAVACKLYETDHGRQVPNLDELVPAYLEAIPSDTLRPGREPVRLYRKGDKAVLWCTDTQDLEEPVRERPDRGPVVLQFWLTAKPAAPEESDSTQSADPVGGDSERH